MKKQAAPGFIFSRQLLGVTAEGIREVLTYMLWLYYPQEHTVRP